MNTINIDEFAKIGEAFCLQGTLISVEQLCGGNINKTYFVKYLLDDGTEKSYLFQRVNTYVFKNPVQVMENIDHVTTHIYKKRSGLNALHFHHTADRKNYYSVENKDYFWRVRNYFPSETYDICDDLRTLYYAGYAFGTFQMDLDDFDASTLYETIVDFHNTKKRLDTLFRDAEKDEYHRADSVKEELSYIRSVYDEACTVVNLRDVGKVPVRVTHNDTKINNVLFDEETKLPLTVIDLDTVMPGLMAYDFGDAVRFSASTAEEDEKDISKIALDMEKYKAFAEGFISAVKTILTEEEQNTMAMGCFCITIELAARFLDDYLTGDKYFKVLYEGHNLVRTRAQLALAKDMNKKLSEMQKIVDELCSK